MGEAKRRQASAARIVYHHTSALRTNLIWMAGVIEVEGRGKAPVHPQLDHLILGGAGALVRRAMKDFPPLAWFTTQIAIPGCLRNTAFTFRNRDGSVNHDAHALWEALGPRAAKDVNAFSDAIALHRVALGFPIADIPVTPWPAYRGYDTPEGRELNESAREFGDNPDDWYVSEQPVDVLKASEAWASRTKYNPKLVRQDRYLKEVRAMVTLCREVPNTYIAPSWLSAADKEALKSFAGDRFREIGAC